MDYEKKYKESLRKATKIHRDDNEEIKHYMEVLFPELAESKDERIMKELVEHCRNIRCVTEEGAERIAKWIAWLEKKNEIDKESYEIAEKEKYDFVSGQFIECRKSFNEFKEGNSYWLEYAGNDNYIGRSDNILNQKFHITPRQLYRLFTQQHCPKEEYVEPKDYNSIDPHFCKPIDKIEPKFKLGDKIRIKNPSSFDKDMEVARIEKDYYICNHIGKFSSEVVPFSKESDYELIEHKSANKVELKFHEGDWVVYKNDICQIVKREEGCNKLVTNFGIEKELVNERNLSTARLWTIHDAKDGNVLSDGTTIFIFKDLLSDGSVMSYCDYDTDSGESDAFCPLSVNLMCSKITPATKDERAILFEKIKEAGYEWSDKKKKLKKIEQKSTEWSEEDDYNLQCMLAKVASDIQKGIGSRNNVLIDWLKSLKNRIK